jgi:hypothetical protein
MIRGLGWNKVFGVVQNFQLHRANTAEAPVYGKKLRREEAPGLDAGGLFLRHNPCRKHRKEHRW